LSFCWSLGKTLELISVNSLSQWIAYQFLFLAMHFGGVNWLILCAIYTRKKLNILLISLPAMLIHIFFLTNPYHFLYFTTVEYFHLIPGIGFRLAVIIAILYTIIGITLMIHYMIDKNSYIKQQTFLLILSMFIPVIIGLFSSINMIYFKDSLSIRHLSAISFSLTTTIVAIIVFRYKFLNIVPIAHRKIFDTLKDAIVLVDYSNKIIDYNASFGDNFPINQNDLIYFLKENIEDTQISKFIISEIENSSNSNIQGEVAIKGRNVYYYINVQPLYIEKNVSMGRIISFVDVTEYRKTLNKINDLNNQLTMTKLEPQLVDLLKNMINGFQDVYNKITKKTDIKNEVIETMLTNREKRVILLIIQGKSNKEIAATLNRSVGRIKNIITSILDKLGLEDRTQIAVFALKNNLVGEDFNEIHSI
jgi:DNA-binding CsgD family transcriptional regulator